MIAKSTDDTTSESPSNDADRKRQQEILDEALDKFAPWGSLKDQGFTHLHMAMNSIAPVKTIRLILEARPEDAIQQDLVDGMTPLHVGLKEYGYNAIAIKTLVKACPESVKLPDRNGKIALHYCMEYDVSVGSLLAVLGASAECYNATDNMGRTALHIGLINGTSEDSILELLRECPSASNPPKYESWTPLHWAMSCNVETTIVKALLDSASVSPTISLMEKDSDGKTPLHVAMGMCAKKESVELIVKACPESAKIKDHEGWYPLHHGIRYKAPLGACRVVQEAFPDAVVVAGENGGHKPYEVEEMNMHRNRRAGYRIKNQ